MKKVAVEEERGNNFLWWREALSAQALTTTAPSKETILVVDDEPRSEGFGMRLSMIGYTVVTACDGTEALELPQCVPDLVVLDVMMRLDGYGLARIAQLDASTMPLSETAPVRRPGARRHDTSLNRSVQGTEAVSACAAGWKGQGRIHNSRDSVTDLARSTAGLW